MGIEKPIRSILIATDLEEGSAEAVRNAAAIATAASARLHVVHVHEEAFASTNDILDSQRDIHEKRLKLHAIVDEAFPGAVQQGSVRVSIGAAAEVILREAKAVEADLIVLGRHRHRGIADRVIGGTAEHILRRATIPCLLLNAPLTLPLGRALVPCDFSAPSRRAAEAALRWVDLWGRDGAAAITLAHVMDASVQLNQKPWIQQEREKELEESAADAVQAAGSAVPIEPAILRGTDAAAALLTRAEEDGAGLIVIGTHGDRMLVRALLGSVSSAVLRRAPMPVMLVPRPVGAVADARSRNRDAARAEPIPA